MKPLFHRIAAAIAFLGVAASVAVPQARAESVTSNSFTHATTAAPTVAEVADFTAVADVAGSLAGKYFLFGDAANAHLYYVWFKVSSVGTDPAVANRTGIEVDFANDETATNIATAIRAAIGGSGAATYVTVGGATTHVILTSILKGAQTDAAVGNSGFSVSITTAGVSGTAAITASGVLTGLNGWKICADAVQTSTWIGVGKADDPDTDGTRIGKGECFECVSCSRDSLRLVKLSSQAASGGYTVVQFK